MRSCYVLIYLRLAVFFIIIIISNFQKYFFQQKSIFFTEYHQGRTQKEIQGAANMCEAQKSSPPPRIPDGGGQNLNCKFKTFGFIDTLKLHKLQANTLQLLLYLSFKQNQKKKSANYSVSGLKSVIALSSGGWGLQVLGRHYPFDPPPCVRP